MNLKYSKTKYSKTLGQFYTRDIFMDDFLKNITYDKPIGILEPSFGSGVLFIRTINDMLKKFSLDEIEDVVKKSSLYELDINSYKIGKTNVLEFLKEKTIKTKPFFKNSDFLKAVPRGENLIICNPPYIRKKSIQKETIDGISDKYKEMVSGNYDMYSIFIAKLMKEWNKARIMAIIPSSFMEAKYALQLRGLITNTKHSIYSFSEPVEFDKTSYSTIILDMQLNISGKAKYYKDYIEIENSNLQINLKAKNPIATLDNKFFIIDKTFKLGLYIKNAVWSSGEKKKIIFPYKKIKEGYFPVTKQEVLDEHPELEDIFRTRVINKNRRTMYPNTILYGRSQYIQEYFRENIKYLIPSFIKGDIKIIKLKKNDIPMSGIVVFGNLSEIEKELAGITLTWNIKNGGYYQISTKNFEKRNNE